MNPTTDNLTGSSPSDPFGDPFSGPGGSDPFLGNIIGGIGQALGGLFGETEGEAFGDPFGPEQMGGDLLGADNLGDPFGPNDPFTSTDPFTSDGFGGNFESEWFSSVDGFNPQDSEYEAEASATLMEVLADRFANDQEGDNFLPILAALAPLALKALPIAKKLAPMALRAARKAMPHLARGAAQITRRLAKSRLGKEAIRVAPTILRGAAANVLQQVQQGRPVSVDMVKRSLAGATASVLRNPQRIRHQIQRNRRVAQRVTGVLQMRPA